MKKVITTFLVSLVFFFNASALENYEPYPVGELGVAWEFPSDHLPIGATIDNFHIAFWNILNKNYLGHIEENTQGLKDGSILRDNIPCNDLLTLREWKVSSHILELISHPTHPRSLIALQETHEDVANFLQIVLPNSWVVVTPPDLPKTQDIFLYDTAVFEFVDLSTVRYSPEQPRTIFTLTLREKKSAKLFRFIQSHIPGGPNSAEGCAKFSSEVLKQFDSSMTTVLMGDMNQSPRVINQALDVAANELNISQPYSYLPVNYPTHMNTHLHASWIDNFFVFTPNQETIQASEPEDFFEALVPIIHLLEGFAKKEN